eukprot:CAMPEP_0113437822 /NCGR_PEP_ID=MMETSP0013_2-20120614/37629_1 /TAXON_ID=2843 ORGANISM="Skeletonema costatum, Strain 1716" /NCGR_SAMPLE_ID=MMETSP0013_2 /ASSEMBLY_ACC=CAM_ASM_000158 /LENGTH=433 /DNA_ID=CAMNT_0000328519 /DNA_START=131 /DNA_END=1430 /DNA_ORIENTATION=+ /assembly_acc=CAM_ASM_000158
MPTTNTQRVRKSSSSTPIFILHAHKIVVFCSAAIFIFLFAVNLFLVTDLEKQNIGANDPWQIQTPAIHKNNVNDSQVEFDQNDNNINNTATNPVKIIFAGLAAIFTCLFAVNLFLVADLEKHNIGANESWQIQNHPTTYNNVNDNQVEFDTNGNNSNNTATNPVIDYFRRAGVELDNDSIESLPTWSQIESIIGKKPVFRGLDTCETFRQTVPPLGRMLGSAGMFNSGTNLVTRLMKENCVIPERFNKYAPDGSKEDYGIRWQCPWGKHTPANFKNNHTAPKNEEIIKDHCLPIVTVRNPFDWMVSMCNIWPHHRICPHLVEMSSNGKKVPVGVKVKLAEQWLNFDSLADLWNEFYAQYYRDFEYPYLIVRFEDLTFRQYETTKTICECAGGVVKPQNMFKYIIKSAKQGPGHGKVSERTGMVEAWIKYGQPK